MNQYEQRYKSNSRTASQMTQHIYKLAFAFTCYYLCD